jgi:hypothetical protein
MHWVGVAGEIDEPPDLGHSEGREEGRGVRNGSDRAIAPARLSSRSTTTITGPSVVAPGELTESQHRRSAFDVGMMLDESHGTHDAVSELATGTGCVGRQRLAPDGASR